MKKGILFSLLTLAVLSAGCQQDLARSFGGTVNISLPKGQKLVNATWKESNIWYLHRPMRPGEEAETVTFSESSVSGIMQGTVIFKESK